jgi:hypothetical protein
MATHTETTTFSGRKFNIARKNGQVDKEGEPHFFEWLAQPPSGTPGKRIFEQRTRKNGEAAHYELFKKIDGYISGAARREVNYGDKSEEVILLFITDGAEDYTIDLGRFDGRYAMDFLKRILDPNFDAKQRLSLAPFSILNKDSGRYTIGVSVYSGPNKMDAKYDSAHLTGMPNGEKEENRRGEVTWYFDKQANWLWSAANERVLSKIVGDPISFNQPVKVAMPAPQSVLGSGVPLPTVDTTNYEQGAEAGEDLPF